MVRSFKLRCASAVVAATLSMLAGQAQAGSVTIRNEAWVVARTQISAAPNPDQWESLLLGRRNSHFFPDQNDHETLLTVQYLTLFEGWRDACQIRLQPWERRTITLNGTAFGTTCDRS